MVPSEAQMAFGVQFGLGNACDAVFNSKTSLILGQCCDVRVPSAGGRLDEKSMEAFMVPQNVSGTSDLTKLHKTSDKT